MSVKATGRGKQGPPSTRGSQSTTRKRRRTLTSEDRPEGDEESHDKSTGRPKRRKTNGFKPSHQESGNNVGHAFDKQKNALRQHVENANKRSGQYSIDYLLFDVYFEALEERDCDSIVRSRKAIDITLSDTEQEVTEMASIKEQVAANVALRKLNEQWKATVQEIKRPGNPPVARISELTTRRPATVSALYERLNSEHFVMVRGTPASGKSTLAELLRRHIKAEEGVDPIVLCNWPQKKEKFSWLNHLEKYGYDSTGHNTIIIDEAQLTYWSGDFWNGYLKAIKPEGRDRVILFASYGSATGEVAAEVNGTTTVIPDRRRVSLRPVNHENLGLLLMEEEFDDMVHRLYPQHRFSREFLKYIFDATAGHPGAVEDLLRIVSTDDMSLLHRTGTFTNDCSKSYRRIKITNKQYNLETFWTKFPLKRLWDGLDSTSVFRRGLPPRSTLQDPAVARVFRAVLRDNATKRETFGSQKDLDALDQCWKKGWLHATQDPPIYIFTTPLHQWFVEYYLGTNVLDNITIIDRQLLIFATNVIKLFSSKKLSSERTIGVSEKQRSPEAKFRDEFYRCCHIHSQGSLISFLEYGDARERVDFYIPLKEWGVELLCDGDGLENHSSRFTGQGAYAEMVFEDYIILDFRTNVPNKKHPKIPNLYHVVFENDYKHVQILHGSSLKPFSEFELFNSA